MADAFSEPKGAEKQGLDHSRRKTHPCDSVPLDPNARIRCERSRRETRRSNGSRSASSVLNSVLPPASFPQAAGTGTGGKDASRDRLTSTRPACVADCANSPNTRPAATRHRSAARPASAPAFPGQSSALLRLPGDDAHRRLRLPRHRIPICEGWRRHAVSRDSCPARAAPRHSPGRGTHVSENSGFRGPLPTWSGRSRWPSAFAIRRIASEYDSPGPRSRPRRSTVRRSRTTNSPPLPTGRASAFEPLDSLASIAAKASRVIEIVTMRHYGLRHARPAISPLMCNLYSLTKGQAAIREWFRARHDRTGNLPLFVKSLPSATPFRVQYRPSGRDESGRMSTRQSG